MTMKKDSRSGANSASAAKAPAKMPAALRSLLGAQKERAAPSRRDWLALKPVRNPALLWREEESVVVIEIRRAQNWKTRLLNLVFPLPEEHRVALDAIGSTVWRCADGDTTVEQIAKKLARELQIERREAEASLQQFFKELGRRGYIAFKVESDTPNGPSSP
jgi:CO/xanthine dehydrogenase FAD-binding subunit